MGKAKAKTRAKKEQLLKEQAANKKLERANRKAAYKDKQRKRARQGHDEDRQFALQLADIGCRVVEVKGDGNCMFRSIADQLEGNNHNHSTIRHDVMTYIEEQREDFEPFMEDDEKFDDYISRMRGDCEWGGHQELYAASQHFSINIIIHQFNAARFEMHAPNPNYAKATIHLSYHGENHYNSVRAQDDHGSGPAEPINLGGGSAGGRAGAGAAEAEEPATDEEVLVLRSVPSVPLSVIRTVLTEVGGDASLAIELLIDGYSGDPGEGEGGADPDGRAVGGEAGGSAAAQNHSAVEGQSSGGDAAAGSSAEAGGAGEAAALTGGSSAGAEPGGGAEDAGASASGKSKGGKSKKSKNASPPPEKPRRQGDCPCGSGLKYKKCCRKKDRQRGREAPSDADANEAPVDATSAGDVQVIVL